MANISKIALPLYGADFVNKINEIIDWCNGITDSSRVVDVSLNENKLVLKYIDGTTSTLVLKNTTYELATTSKSGLMSAEMVANLNHLISYVTTLIKLKDYKDTWDGHSCPSGGGSSSSEGSSGEGSSGEGSWSSGEGSSGEGYGSSAEYSSGEGFSSGEDAGGGGGWV